MKELVIKRNKWARGGEDGTMLYNKGRRCCLGFFSEQICSVSFKKKSRHVGDPGELLTDSYSLPYANKLLDHPYMSELVEKNEVVSDGFKNSSLCMSLIKINDNEDITEEEREKKLQEKFWEIGVDIKFVD